MRLYVISALVIAFLAILFALQNTNLVTIQLFIWSYRQSLALVLLGTLAIGVVIGLLVSVPAVIRRNLKAARMQKQADSLTELVQTKDQAITAESQKMSAVKQSYEELLKSLGVIEPTTGLIRQDLIGKAIATQLDHFKRQENLAQLPSLSVLIFKALPVLEDGYPLKKTFAAVAARLQQQASTKTWLYSDGRGLFTATISGLDLKTATSYAEELQAAILENPPTLPTGEAQELDVSVGGAIADTLTTIDGNHLLETAEHALDQALQRGRNRVRILQVS
ncbi:lipopolysaccharide assembly protein LapA domain-containing protein [Oscillatoria sp. CS-180]|uniref:lipopolysaccharide assembly protein LapA domain-containing protein n=1 Tax=Oscillatoria sp. CS-180 TaxID=3021720 RepID=UPI00232DD756|nr:lipopolysaccharide assembly protein LapA domain-containing protein [Oscillatoria sp. CS-180]MDB9528985.1 lipopolysaccharide assembly protein LapA domain-containing protein [Oscillatoria sp. CS-180]